MLGASTATVLVLSVCLSEEEFSVAAPTLGMGLGDREVRARIVDTLGGVEELVSVLAGGEGDGGPDGGGGLLQADCRQPEPGRLGAVRVFILQHRCGRHQLCRSHKLVLFARAMSPPSGWWLSQSACRLAK